MLHNFVRHFQIFVAVSRVNEAFAWHTYIMFYRTVKAELRFVSVSVDTVPKGRFSTNSFVYDELVWKKSIGKRVRKGKLGVRR